jgi:HSP20 family protein
VNTTVHRRFIMNAYTFWKELDSLTEGLLTTSTPRVDVVETKDTYQLVAELPGFGKDEVTVQVKNGVLEIAATPAQESKTEEATWLVRERRVTGLSRSFRLPRDVDGDAIAAEFRNGLLVLTLPKKEEAKPRVVEIRAA